MRAAVAALLVVAAALVSESVCAGEGLRLLVPGISRHDDRTKDYNELNLGIGIERRMDDKWLLAARYFRNSNRDNSFSPTVSYLPWRLGSVQFGSAAGFVTGYNHGKPVWFVLPTATIEGKDIGINIVRVPRLKGGTGVWAVEFKFPF